MEAAVEEFLDLGPLEGDGLEVALVVVVEERQRFSSICRRQTENVVCLRPPESRQLSPDRLTVQDDSHQRLVVLVEDLPQGEGLGRRVGQQSEEQADGVVGGKSFRMDVPVSTISSRHHTTTSKQLEQVQEQHRLPGSTGN